MFRKILLLIAILFLSVPVSADKYIVFIDKNSSQVAVSKDGVKASYEAGEVIGMQPLPKGCEDLTKCVSPNELQNNFVIIMDLTEAQRGLLLENNLKDIISEDGKTEKFSVERKRKFDIQEIQSDYKKEIVNVQEVIDNMSVKSVFIDDVANP